MNLRALLLPIITLILLSAFAGGCGGKRVVLVPAGEPVQLAEDVKAYVYVNGERSANRVMLPHGWWCLPDTGE